MRPTLILMVKEPRPGRAKTRLGRDLGLVPAAWWFRHQTARLIREVGRDPRWRTWLAVSPDVEGMASRVWPADIARVPQGRGDLGARMRRLMIAALPGPVAVIGGDVPGITAGGIRDAFAMLGRCEAVFGPAEDGGYWLVGLARRGGRVPPGLFAGVRWSTADALADSLRTVEGARVGYVRSLRDVDTISDLRAVTGRARRP